MSPSGPERRRSFPVFHAACTHRPHWPCASIEARPLSMAVGEWDVANGSESGGEDARRLQRRAPCVQSRASLRPSRALGARGGKQRTRVRAAKKVLEWVEPLMPYAHEWLFFTSSSDSFDFVYIGTTAGRTASSLGDLWTRPPCHAPQCPPEVGTQPCVSYGAHSVPRHRLGQATSGMTMPCTCRSRQPTSSSNSTVTGHAVEHV